MRKKDFSKPSVPKVCEIPCHPMPVKKVGELFYLGTIDSLRKKMATIFAVKILLSNFNFFSSDQMSISNVNPDEFSFPILSPKWN